MNPKYGKSWSFSGQHGIDDALDQYAGKDKPKSTTSSFLRQGFRLDNGMDKANEMPFIIEKEYKSKSICSTVVPRKGASET